MKLVSRVVSLGSFPTPVARIGPNFWVKRDDLTSEVYGGNKVRKLEYLLGAACDAGKRRILTMGAAGSHQVVATALFGARLGFEVEAVLVSQPASDHARLNLRVALAQGLRATPAPAWSVAPAIVLARWRPGTYYVPLGGSNPLGSIGFVDAGRELAAQVAAGELPEPEVVVVAAGSGGTAAGLAVGFEAAGLRTRVVAAAVSDPAVVLGVLARRLARRTAVLVGLDGAAAKRAAARITVESEWVGRGYGLATADGDRATAEATAMGLAVDATYTAKAFACALAHVRRGTTVLYWHTLSTAPLAGLAGTAVIPRNLAGLLR